MNGKRTNENPNLTLFLNPSGQEFSSPVKRRKLDRVFEDTCNVAESSDASGELADAPVERLEKYLSLETSFAVSIADA